MEGWDPQLDDYQCQQFNSYDRGPGKYLEKQMELA